MRLVRSVLLLSLVLSAGLAFAQLYATASGSKYHVYKNCPGLKQAKKVNIITLSQARKKHLTMCDLCQAEKRKQNKPKKSGG